MWCTNWSASRWSTMNNTKLQDFVTQTAARSQITFGDVRRLRRDCLPGGINAGEESDRLLISWQLDSVQAEAAGAGRAIEPDVEKLVHGGATAVVSVGAAGEPVAGIGSSRVLICQVPEDIVSLRRSDPAAARSWRVAVRRALGDAVDAGYTVTGATRGGWYVLER